MVSKDKNYYIIPTIFAILVVLGIILTGNFLWQERSKIINKKQEVASLEKDLETLDQALVGYNQSHSKVDLLAKSLPNSYEEVAYFIAQLERIAKDNDLTLEVDLPNDVTQTDGMDLLKINLLTGGNYNDLTQMLSALRQLPYHTQVISMKISGMGHEIEAEIGFNLFVQIKGEK